MKLFNIFKKKHKAEEPKSNAPELFFVKLFFIDKPEINDEQINEALEKRFENIGFPEQGDLNSNSRHYFFKDYEVEFKEGSIPAQGTILIPDKSGIDFNKLETSFQQNWNWKEAESVVRNCKYEILLTDILSRNLDYKLRLEFFQKFVASIVETMDPNGIWIANGDQLFNKQEYLNCFEKGDYQNLIAFMKVRLFNLEETNDEMIMDTIGLSALGLPDFEMRFKTFDPSVIAGLLFNYGSYIYEKGVVIENGNTIQGIEESQRWKCYFRESSIEPKRITIVIENPS